MKKLLILFIVCISLIPSAMAQIALKVEMPQYTFLQYEPVYAKITMLNMSGRPLAFGETSGLAGMLRFEIYSAETNVYAQLLSKDTPTMTGIILLPGKMRIFTYNVSSFYALKKLGHYSFKAVISHPQLDSAYESNTAQFSIVAGHVVWQTTVGVPLQEIAENTKKDTKDPSKQDMEKKVQVRRYRISSYYNGNDSIYVLFIEDDKKIYFVTQLGMDLGYQLRPQCAVDEANRLHLLVAANYKVFAYYQYDINGHLDKKEVRIKTDTNPHLVVNKDMNTVVLEGGRKARVDMDYEEIKSLPYISKALEETDKSVTVGRKLLDTKED